tara:strand:- start:242 stop:571 length:330 start_codon:yes stop_codon:yes gene_type:complete
MNQRIIDVTISPDLNPTTSDILRTDCLRIETSKKVYMEPNGETRVNLTVHNTTSVGRMGNIIANFDARELTVKIPNNQVYVAPEGKTMVYAIINALIKNGRTKVSFDVF